MDPTDAFPGLRLFSYIHTFPILLRDKSVAFCGFRSAHSCGAAPESNRLPPSDRNELNKVTLGLPVTGF
jgi:hypothetical protein